MPKYKNYGKLYPYLPQEIMDALGKSDEKIKYTEYNLKHGKYDNEKHTYKESREVSLDMLEETGIQFPSSAESIENIVVRSLLIEQMRKAVAHLLPEEKKLIFYYFVSEKSQKECAKIFGVSRRTIGYRLKKIYEKLKRYIEI